MFLWGKNIFKLQRWRECWSVMLKLSFSSADQRWTEQPNKWNCKDLENCWTALGMLHFRYFRQNVSGTANFLVGCHNLYTSILVYQCLNKQGTGKMYHECSLDKSLFQKMECLLQKFLSKEICCEQQNW